MARKNDGLSRPLKAFALASTIAVQFASSVFLGVWLGSLLDEKFDTHPWLMIGGLFAGLGAGMLGVYRIVVQALNNRNNQSSE